MSAIGLLIVEGNSDLQFMAWLNRSGYSVKSCGGKGQMRAVMQSYASIENNAEKYNPKHIVAFRDRDFDFPMPKIPTCSLSNQKSYDPANDFPVFISHRRTLENYLIRPEDYVAFLEAKQEDLKWLPKASEYNQRLHQAAVDIRYHQAVRAALGEVRRMNDIGTNLLASNGESLRSGVLPDLLGEDACLESAAEILNRYRENAVQIGDYGNFENAYQRYISSFDADFYASAKYLEWFQGKDLIAAFNLKWLGASQRFPWNSLHKYTLLNFDHTQFPDLVEFRLILQQRLSQN